MRKRQKIQYTVHMSQFKSFMDVALAAAEACAKRGEVPVGAAVVGVEGKVIAAEGNRTEELGDPTAHAEMLAIRKACEALGTPRLTGCDLYVTLEPCPMCAAAISFARISRLYYGASDPKSGGIRQGPAVFTHPQCHHKPEVYGGISEERAGKILSDFFRARRGDAGFPP